jgi:hypothetical protein
VPLRLIGAMNIKVRAEGRLGTEKWRLTNIARDLYGGSGGGVVDGAGSMAWSDLGGFRKRPVMSGVERC